MNPMTHAEALKALFVEGADLDLTDRHAAQYALGLAGRIERAAQTLIDSLVDGNDAMRAVCDEPPFSDEPFTDQLRQTIAARKAQTFKVGDRVGISDAGFVWQGASDGEVVLVDGDPGDCSFKVKLDSPFGRYEHLWVYAWMLKHADSIPVATPAEDAALDEIEARQVEAFADALAQDATHDLMAEARQVDLAKPEVFNIAGWVQDYFKQKGA